MLNVLQIRTKDATREYIYPYSGHTTFCTFEYSCQNVPSFRCYPEKRCGDEGMVRLRHMPLWSQEFWHFKTTHNGHVFYLHFALSDWIALHFKHKLFIFPCNSFEAIFHIEFILNTGADVCDISCIHKIFHTVLPSIHFKSQTLFCGVIAQFWTFLSSLWNRNTFIFETSNKALFDEAITFTFPPLLFFSSFASNHTVGS